MPGLLLILALQAVAPPSAPSPQSTVPQKFSILAPVPGQPCVRQPTDDATVCGNALPPQRLQYPENVGPRRPQPSNPELTGAGALDAMSMPCAARLGGCQVGFGPPIVPIIKGVAGVIGNALKKKPDKTGRVPIPLDDPAPTGTIEP